MAFERVHMLRPVPPERVEPLIELLQWFGVDAVHAILCFRARLDEACFTQHSQMLRDGGLRHAERALELPDGAVGRRQQAEDGPPARFGDDGESRFHGPYITDGAYACQGMDGWNETPALCPAGVRATRTP